ncbi:hypothetical protein BUALT_Bualt12G0117300 [Buddleja alternifolia]|uniref:Uncharacterized protein n=1 Tax=Buddleja alternifolia TaxID=168488 RepID=A0AAV6WQP4_9LAMI|nr:hypothetical protein BUALT_Bualt12G0117300 [Buddleja alternifolia]
MQMRTEPVSPSEFISFHEQNFIGDRIFDELPKATIVQVSRPDASDITPMQLAYTIEFLYKQVKEWLQNLGIGDHAAVMQDDDDDAVPSRNDETARNRDVPSIAALPIIRPELGRQHSMSDRAKGAMQGYLNHFLSNIDIVNSKEVISLLLIAEPEILGNADEGKCCSCQWLCCCRDNWQKLLVIPVGGDVKSDTIMVNILYKWSVIR